MNPDLKLFTLSTLRAVVPAFLAVATVAFVTIPYSLGHHPGEPVVTTSAANRHMT